MRGGQWVSRVIVFLPLLLSPGPVPLEWFCTNIIGCFDVTFCHIYMVVKYKLCAKSRRWKARNDPKKSGHPKTCSPWFPSSPPIQLASPLSSSAASAYLMSTLWPWPETTWRHFCFQMCILSWNQPSPSGSPGSVEIFFKWNLHKTLEHFMPLFCTVSELQNGVAPAAKRKVQTGGIWETVMLLLPQDEK